MLVAELVGLQRPDVQRWIDNDLIRPGGVAGAYEFLDVDVARVRLIRELRDELDINEATLPIVLLLLDQLHDLRRRLRELGDAVEQTSTSDIREALVRHLSKTSVK